MTKITEIQYNVHELASPIAELISSINCKSIEIDSVQKWKQILANRIHPAMAIEEHLLKTGELVDIIDHKFKKLKSPRKYILEALSLMNVYDSLKEFNPFSEKSFLLAHRLLMNGLMEDTGKYRSNVHHLFKPGNPVQSGLQNENGNHRMKELFEWLNNSKENLLNRSCIFHYEVVNIHPFPDGNGKMGRLWQTLILMQEIKAFELIPLEYYIQGSLEKYYDALYSSDKTTGEKSFVEYMFSLIEKALRDYHDSDFLLK